MAIRPNPSGVETLSGFQDELKASRDWDLLDGWNCLPRPPFERRVENVVLYESVNGPEGLTYQSIQEFRSSV